ncbi:actin, clone 302-like [Spea bombifrons]|uniref:actin, clone 302-like n=1 Tax=Spea bombifrons TaxID=233779 RepID=UPI00234B39CD|nr:actin, clone 302-like [Spea bombifrons]
MAVHLPAVIFDNGSGLCKAGLSGENFPRSAITSVIGRARAQSYLSGTSEKDYYIGDEAQAFRGILNLKYPIEHGIVTCWEDMEKIWRYMYNNKLRIVSSERPVLLTEVPFNPLKNREKMTEIMFEAFNVPAVYIAMQAMLELYSSGFITGVVVGSGDGVTHTNAIFEGYHLAHSGSRLHVAGRDITDYLMRILPESSIFFVNSAEREIVRDIKEKLCYVALDPEVEMKCNTKQIKKGYKLPDGNIIEIDNQLFRAPEILFAPSHIGIEAPGIHQMIFNSITKCDIDNRRNLFNCIVLSGGSTLFPGLEKRVLKEVRRLAPAGLPVNIIAPQHRHLSAWTGASVLSSQSSFTQRWVTVCDYKEYGPSIVHKKCS